MEISLQKAGMRDLPLLLRWRERSLREVFCLPESGELSPLMAATERYYAKALADGSHVAVWAKDARDGTPLGCGGICYQWELPSPDNDNGFCGYLMNIYTAPDYRRLGIGERVVRYLIDDARAKGVRKITLETSEVARSVYQKLGFSDFQGCMILR